MDGVIPCYSRKPTGFVGIDKKDKKVDDRTSEPYVFSRNLLSHEIFVIMEEDDAEAKTKKNVVILRLKDFEQSVAVDILALQDAVARGMVVVRRRHHSRLP